MKKSIKDRIKVLFPNLYFSYVLRKVHKNFLSFKDKKTYSSDKYNKEFGIDFDLNEPKTFYEKVCFLKLFCDEPDSEKYVDKILVKDFLKKMGLEKYVAKSIASFFTFKDFRQKIKSIIAENKAFVVKLNHTSGDVFFFNNSYWRDKEGNKISKRYVFACLKHKLKLNYYEINFEKQYINIVPQILVEEYLPSLDNKGLDEYKFFLNKGKIKMINVVYGRQKSEGIKEAFTNENLELLGAHQNQQTLKQEEIYKPACFDEMVDFCKKTVSDKLLIRVDLMTNGNTFYFCEFTYYDCAGFNVFYPLEYNKIIGSLFDIDE